MRIVVGSGLGLLLLGAAIQAATPGETGTVSPDQQVAAMEVQCANSADARGKRHSEKPLFERLGGQEKIHALTTEVMRLHLQNDAVKHFFAESDTTAVADRVAKFIISGTGGPTVYEGPDLTTSHAAMKLTNADFLEAGGDIVQAMQNLGHGQDEIDELICALVAMRDQVVLSAAAEGHEHEPGDGHEH